MSTVESLESEIYSLLNVEQSEFNFSYKEEGGVTILDLTTFNPRHSQSFLFHSVKAIDKIEALTKMTDYIKTHFTKEESFTLQWVKIGENQLQTSYFRAKNFYDVLDKFFFEREINTCKIFSISLNPIS